MTTETANIIAIILGAIAVLEPFILSYMTDKLIQKEDERAKRMIEQSQRMIEEGNKRHEELIKETQRMIEEGNKRHEELIKETQRIIDEGNKRLEKIIIKIDESTKEILAEIIKKV